MCRKTKWIFIKIGKLSKLHFLHSVDFSLHKFNKSKTKFQIKESKKFWNLEKGSLCLPTILLSKMKNFLGFLLSFLQKKLYDNNSSNLKRQKIST